MGRSGRGSSVAGGPAMKKQPLTNSEPDMNTTVALYARVSSDRQDVDLSVAAQLRALRDYAEKNGHSVAQEYIDEAESGRIADRPQFRKMLDEASAPDAPFKEIQISPGNGLDRLHDPHARGKPDRGIRCNKTRLERASYEYHACKWS